MLPFCPEEGEPQTGFPAVSASLRDAALPRNTVRRERGGEGVEVLFSCGGGACRLGRLIDRLRRGFAGRFQPEVLVDVSFSGGCEGGIFAAVFDAVCRAILLQRRHGLAGNYRRFRNFFLRWVDGKRNSLRRERHVEREWAGLFIALINKWITINEVHASIPRNANSVVFGYGCNVGGNRGCISAAAMFQQPGNIKAYEIEPVVVSMDVLFTCHFVVGGVDHERYFHMAVGSFPIESGSGVPHDSESVACPDILAFDALYGRQVGV